MKVLIVYDSVSPQKNTERIAKEISAIFAEKGLDVDCLHVSSVDRNTVHDYDFILVGSPTMAFSATAPIKNFLKGFSDGEFAGKSAAAFDTRVKLLISGQAAKGIQQKLEKIGFKIIAQPLVAYVAGSTKKNDFVLKEGELEKTGRYAQELAIKLKAS